MKKVIIFCDGSSQLMSDNCRKSAAAAILIYQNSTANRFEILTEPLASATNNQAEIVAACIGLENLKQPSNVEVFSDSRYLIETMKGSFKKHTNKDWWKRLEQSVSIHNITWHWIRGHNKHPLQEIADYLARKTAELQQTPNSILQKAQEKISKLIHENKVKIIE